MGPVAAQAQALFADQTDGQLTQGSASAIHTLLERSRESLSFHYRSAAQPPHTTASQTPTS